MIQQQSRAAGLNRLLTKAASSSVLLSILSAFAVGAVFMIITGSDPITGYTAMVKGSFGTGIGFTNTINRAIPIVCFGIAIAIAFRAGIFNLGAEGQAVLGALTGGLVALYLPGPAILVTIAAIITAFITGALWGLITAVLQNLLGVPILISTLLLNYPARFFSSWLIRFKLNDPSTDLIASAQINKDVLLPYIVPRGSEAAKSLAANFGGTSHITSFLTGVNVSLFLVITLLVAVVFMNAKTKYGFESGLAGKNPEFTRYGGVNPGLLTVKTMVLSGGLAGVAGVLLVIGLPNTRMLEGHVVQTGYAYTALLVTLLALYRPLGTAIAGVFFAAIMVGSDAMGRELGMSPQISAVIQSLVIIFISFKIVLPQLKKSRSAAAAGGAK